MMIDLNLFMIIFFHSLREWLCLELSDTGLFMPPPSSFVMRWDRAISILVLTPCYTELQLLTPY